MPPKIPDGQNVMVSKYAKRRNSQLDFVMTFKYWNPRASMDIWMTCEKARELANDILKELETEGHVTNEEANTE